MQNWKVELATEETTLEEIQNHHTLRCTFASAICYSNDATELYG